jgi:hypothetical protein
MERQRAAAGKSSIFGKPALPAKQNTPGLKPGRCVWGGESFVRLNVDGNCGELVLPTPSSGATYLPDDFVFVTGGETLAAFTIGAGAGGRVLICWLGIGP